jgi:hypothetical protein
MILGPPLNAAKKIRRVIKDKKKTKKHIKDKKKIVWAMGAPCGACDPMSMDAAWKPVPSNGSCNLLSPIGSTSQTARLCINSAHIAALHSDGAEHITAYYGIHRCGGRTCRTVLPSPIQFFSTLCALTEAERVNLRGKVVGILLPKIESFVFRNIDRLDSIQ